MKISIKVKPGSKKGPLVESRDDGELTVYVREPAVDGKANKAVVEIIAKHFDVPKKYVTIITGHSFREKVLNIVDEPY